MRLGRRRSQPWEREQRGGVGIGDGDVKEMGIESGIINGSDCERA